MRLCYSSVTTKQIPRIDLGGGIFQHICLAVGDAHIYFGLHNVQCDDALVLGYYRVG